MVKYNFYVIPNDNALTKLKKKAWPNGKYEHAMAY